MHYPPSPPASFITGHLKGFKNDPINFMLDAANDYGDIVLFKLLNKKIYFINHPDYIRHVLHTHHKNYHKSPGYRPLRLLAGMGIFTSDGEQWLRQRKLYQPAFSHSSIAAYSSTVITQSETLTEEWKAAVSSGKPINISRDMMKITMGIISETLFSNRIDYQTDLWDAISYALKWVNDRALKNPFVLPANWPTAKNRKFKAAVSRLDELVYDIIDQKKQHNTNPDDLLSRFMQPEGDLKGLNPKELRDEVMTLFIAGHETSANVLMWAFYELSRHQEIEENIAKEVTALGERKLTFNDLHQLIYTTQVLNETMRLYPPVWHLGRMNLAADQLGDYSLPAGSHVRISPLVLHRHPAFWQSPDRFDPERFIERTPEGISARAPQPFTFIPFGAGPRLCAGRNFAMMEMVLILAQLVRTFKIESNSAGPVELGPLMTLRPKEDVLLKFSLRS